LYKEDFLSDLYCFKLILHALSGKIVVYCFSFEVRFGKEEPCFAVVVRGIVRYSVREGNILCHKRGMRMNNPQIPLACVLNDSGSEIWLKHDCGYISSHWRIKLISPRLQSGCM
jgi:hypothetical protein